MPFLSYTPPHATAEMKVTLVLLFVSACVGVAVLCIDRVPKVAARIVAAVLLLVSVVWLRISKPIEGPVLKTLSPRHGVTVADLIVLPCGVIAVGLFWVASRGRVGQRAGAEAADRAPLD